MPAPVRDSSDSTMWNLIIGIGFGAYAVIALLINLLVLASMVRGKMLNKKASPIYILSSQNVIMETLQILVYITYYVPSVIKQDWLFTGGARSPPVLLASTITVMCWSHSGFSSIFIALNRFTVIVASSSFFSRGRVIACAALIYILALAFAITVQYITPCCLFSFDYRFYSYSYVGDGFNYSNAFFDLPLNIASTATSAICYTSIVIYVHRARRSISNMSITSDKKDRREYSYAMQFCAVSLAYTIAWMGVRAFPVLIGNTEHLQVYSLIALFVLMNASANSTIYLINNQEIKRHAATVLRPLATAVHSADLSHSAAGGIASHVTAAKQSSAHPR